jgi:aspartyl-tRNA(Asn)/glutamyl-tRNA(Gln) amidotransferase subunit A
MTQDITKLSLCDLQAAVHGKRVSPVELMQATFARIDTHNPQVNALVTALDRDRLLAAAREAEQRIMRGEARPLEGMPLGVKDLEDAEGFVTSFGSVPFAKNLAKRDSTQVARFRAAGAIVVGKTNVPEFGSAAFTRNRLFGVTRNPWSLEHSPGGSSGGASAALASHMLPLVTGSDGGGSVRIPACLVGAFGLKPSYGRIPTGPRERWHFIDTEHFGPITKTVSDAALFLDQVVGVCPYDESSLPHPGYRYTDKLEEKLPRLRIAYSPDFGDVRVQREVAVAVEDGVRVLEKLGHEIVPLRGGPPHTAAAWVFLNNVDGFAHFSHMLKTHGEEFGRGFAAGLRTAAHVTPDQLEITIKHRARLVAWCAELFADHDLLITPTVPYDGHPAQGPYPLEIDGEPTDAPGPGAFTIPWNLSYHPAASVRVGLSSRGLPMGMQIVGPRHRDDVVMQVARAFERERPWHPHWPA